MRLEPAKESQTITGVSWLHWLLLEIYPRNGKNKPPIDSIDKKGSDVGVGA